MSNPDLSPVKNDLVLDTQNSPELEQQKSFISSISKKYKKLKVGNLMVLVGQEHFYQYFCLIMMILVGIIEGTYKFAIPYLFYNVQFECLNIDGEYEKCPMTLACSSNTKFRVNSDIFSINQSFDLYCEKQSMVMYSIFLIIAGGSIIAFFMFFVADYFGRKICFFFGLMVHIASISIINVARSSMMITVIALTLNMAAVFMWYSNVTVFLNESLGGITRLISMPLIMCSRSFGIMFNALIFYFLPNYIHAMAVLLIILASVSPCYFFFQETLFFQFEKSNLGQVYSTAKRICNVNFNGLEKEKRNSYIYKMLFCMNKPNDLIMKVVEIDEALPLEPSGIQDSRLVFLEKQLKSTTSSKSLDYSQNNSNKSQLLESQVNPILVINRSISKIEDPQIPDKLSPDVIEQIKKLSMTQILNDVHNSQEPKEKNYKDLLKSEHFTKMLGAIVISFTILSANGLTAYSIQSVGFKSIFTAGLWMGIFDLIGALVSAFTASKISNKTILIISQLIFLLASSLLLLSFYLRPHIQDLYLTENSLLILEIISSVSLRFSVSLSQGIAFTYCTELFPTHIRAVAFGIVFTFGRIGMASSSVFIHFLNQINMNPNAAIFVFAVFALPISLFMPNTKMKMVN